MPRQLVADALVQANTREPAIRAPALARAARVLAALDRGEADTVLERAIELLESLPDKDRAVLGPPMLRVAGTVSAEAAWRLLHFADPQMGAEGLLHDMLHDGDADAVVAYLAAFISGTAFPFGVAGEAIGRAADAETKQTILRNAIRAWRDSPTSSHHVRDLPHLLQFYWRILPADEAASVLREMVRRIESDDDGRMNSGFGSGEKKVRLTSIRAHRLFEILGPMQRLAPELAQDALGRYPELAAAARVFPYGHEPEEWHGPPPPPMSPEERAAWVRKHDVIECNGGLLPIDDAIRLEFVPAFDDARRLYDKDVAGNRALKERWPSTQAYRAVLFKSGQYEARNAVRYLDRIPDDDLRLLAQLELAAALAGRRQIGESSMFMPHQFR